MTHDELLAYINEEIEVCDPSCNSHKADNQPWQALRAVVELHKPIYHEYPNGNTETECSHCNDGCWGCEEWQNCGDSCECKCHQAGNEYPCPTIQAIQKELR